MAERRVVDARGSFCPGPLMELIAAMKMAAVGDEVEVLSTGSMSNIEDLLERDGFDYRIGSATDVPEWIRKAKHEHVGTEEKDGVWHIVVKKMK